MKKYNASEINDILNNNLIDKKEEAKIDKLEMFLQVSSDLKEELYNNLLNTIFNKYKNYNFKEKFNLNVSSIEVFFFDKNIFKSIAVINVLKEIFKDEELKQHIKYFEELYNNFTKACYNQISELFNEYIDMGMLVVNKKFELEDYKKSTYIKTFLFDEDDLNTLNKKQLYIKYCCKNICQKIDAVGCNSLELIGDKGNLTLLMEEKRFGQSKAKREEIYKYKSIFEIMHCSLKNNTVAEQLIFDEYVNSMLFIIKK